MYQAWGRSAPQHTPSVRGVNFRAHARRARIRECKEISGAVHAEPGNPWTRPGHGEFHGCVRAGKLLETWVFEQCLLFDGGASISYSDLMLRVRTRTATKQLYSFDPHMLDTPKAHVESFKGSLQYQGPVLWNCLAADQRQLIATSAFKNGL
ncbi:hypothetical protein Bbelb_363930 [Branchiostoma belcheri]|nr:hypothetical protein Bbelb_363930 [Branchiostoma belcheri]